MEILVQELLRVERPQCLPGMFFDFGLDAEILSQQVVQQACRRGVRIVDLAATDPKQRVQAEHRVGDLLQRARIADIDVVQ